MADLIDRDKLFHGQVIFVGTEDARKGVQDVMSVIWDAPTVDAVPVVRCKDCKWWNTTQLDECVAYNALWVANPDDYCSWGERREP